MILNCCIIDDEPLARDLLESYVRKTPFLSLTGKFPSAVNALKASALDQVDLLLLDIQMPDLNGMDFSRMVPERTRVIFTTAFEQYALDSYRVNALDYLLKPISYPDFLQAVNKALRWFEAVRPSGPVVQEEIDSIFVKTEYKLMQIELKDILYIEGFKDYIKIYTDIDRPPVLSLMSMKAIEEVLPAKNFIRVHRSFIVQLSKIKVIERNRIVFGKQYIPISDSYRSGFQAYLNKRSLTGDL